MELKVGNRWFQQVFGEVDIRAVLLVIEQDLIIEYDLVTFLSVLVTRLNLEGNSAGYRRIRQF